MRLVYFIAALVLLLPNMPACAQKTTSSAASSIVLEGDIDSTQNHTYVEVPFPVPSGTTRVTVTFSYTEKAEQHTALDLGLEDPIALRCWSGGNKSLLTVGLSDATPSCEPGPIPAGTWNALIGVPNIRSAVKSHYTLHISFSRTGNVAEQPFELRAPLRGGPGWYRGDLHMHTAHSDGSCPSQTGKPVPCPVYFTADAAARRGLDFIAITDHNATSQYNSMRELQPYFDKLLLIPGREITTFYGHLNLLGTTQYVDFRLGIKAVPDVNTLLRNMDATGAVTSINHPRDETGERCMGCGWSPPEPVDMHLLTAIEAVNGNGVDNSHAGIPFWQEQLNRGVRLTGIGGSDSHRAMTPLSNAGSVGIPTTVVYATELSTPAILEGIRAGHVFLDVKGDEKRTLELSGTANGVTAQMGDLLAARNGVAAEIRVQVTGVSAGRIVLIEDGKEISASQDATITGVSYVMKTQWASDGQRHWIRADVRGASEDLLLVGNPIYINW